MCKPYFDRTNIKMYPFRDQDIISYSTWGKLLNFLEKLLTVALGESSSISSREGEDVLQPRQPLLSGVLGLVWTELI